MLCRREVYMGAIIRDLVYSKLLMLRILHKFFKNCMHLIAGIAEEIVDHQVGEDESATFVQPAVANHNWRSFAQSRVFLKTSMP